MQDLVATINAPPSTILAVLSHSLQRDAHLLATADAAPKPDPTAVFSQSTSKALRYWKRVVGSSWAQDLDAGSASLLAQLQAAAQQWEQVSLIFGQRKDDLQVSALAKLVVS